MFRTGHPEKISPLRTSRPRQTKGFALLLQPATLAGQVFHYNLCPCLQDAKLDRIVVSK